MNKPKIIIALEAASGVGVALTTIECSDSTEAAAIIDNFEAGPDAPTMRRKAWILYDPAERSPGAWG